MEYFLYGYIIIFIYFIMIRLPWALYILFKHIGRDGLLINSFSYMLVTTFSIAGEIRPWVWSYYQVFPHMKGKLTIKETIELDRQTRSTLEEVKKEIIDSGGFLNPDRLKTDPYCRDQAREMGIFINLKDDRIQKNE